MDCCIHPTVKLTKARVVKYKVHHKHDDPPELPAIAQKSAAEIERRVSKLKTKLMEANDNIAILRSCVGQTMDDVNNTGPRTCEEFVLELRRLLIKLDQFDDVAAEIMQRGSACENLLNEIESQSCICALNSPSCAEIKKQLQEILQEKENLNDYLAEMQNVNKEENRQSTLELVDKAKKEISGVKAACSNGSCPNKKGPRKNSKVLMETGMQANKFEPNKRPKLMQTENKPKWDQGTNPSGAECVCKSVQSSKCRKC